MDIRVALGLAAAVLCSGCGSDGQPTGPDFDRQLAPSEYQVRVTGDLHLAVEGTGAAFAVLGTPPFSGWNRAAFHMMGDADALNGAEFNLCFIPSSPGSYSFDAEAPFAGCPSDPTTVAGGFIIQLGAPGLDELDCYPNSYGTKDFQGLLTITTVTAGEIAGEAEGSGICSRHPHSEIEPMTSASVTIRMRFSATR